MAALRAAIYLVGFVKHCYGCMGKPKGNLSQLLRFLIYLWQIKNRDKIGSDNLAVF